jgi:hypothetical protein
MSFCRLYFGRQPSVIESMENGNVKRLVRCGVRELLEFLLGWVRTRRDEHAGK